MPSTNAFALPAAIPSTATASARWRALYTRLSTPASHRFSTAGIATVAGALCFYIVQAHAFADGNKRTAVVASTSFMALNGLKLSYPIDQKAGHNALADLVESCGASQVPKASMMKWFDHHKQSF